MTSKRFSRNYSLDLLRIIAMFLIVLIHSITHNGILDIILHQPWSATKSYIYTVYAFSHICVNCYVLLSGYFLVRSRFNLHKLLCLWIQTVFYTILFKSIFMACGVIPFSITSLLSCFFPIFIL